MRLSRLKPLLLPALLLPGLAIAAEPTPEIQRPVSAPQADGRIHTVRVIPEACTRLEGRFTGNADEPYQMRPARSDANCQARVRLVDAATVNPERGGGWTYYDRIRIPRTSCPQQVAVVDLWKKAGAVTTPQKDAQGRVRVYLQDAMDPAKVEAARAAMPQIALRLGVEGAPCG